MSEQIRCPFCESAIPREALFCSRCGGKIPRTAATAAGLGALPPPASASASPVAPSAPGLETPPIPPASPASAGAGRAPTPSASVSTPSMSPAPTSGGDRASGSSSSMSMSTSSGMSVSQIQKGSRGWKIALVVVGAGLCIAAGWALGHRGTDDEPIAAVPAPAVVELGQPRVALGADLPDPSRFIEPVPVPAPNGVRPTKGGARAPTKASNGAAVRPVSNGGEPPAGQQGGQPGAQQGGGQQAGQQGGAQQGGQNTPAPDPPAPDPPPDPPQGEPDPDVPEGVLDTRAVIFVVRHYLPQVRACYERQLRNEPELRGQITMRFTVGAGGRVVDTDVVLNSTGSDQLAACVSSNLRTWRFPEPEGGAVAFEYPFRFGSPGATPQLPGATQDP